MIVTAVYSILHFLVDGICALAMFGRFVTGSQGYEYFLVYNFCAFALQMPFGAILDSLALKREKNDSMICAVLGVLVTILGAWSHPAILGIGNALYHVGAGVSVIREDHANGWKGQALGIFVAPGALGLFIGTKMAHQEIGVGTWLVCISVTIAMAIVVYISEPKKCSIIRKGLQEKGSVGLLVCCFVVVILRSYVGMAVTFEWKITLLASTLGVLAVVLGKMAGGILSARIGVKTTVVGSLAVAAICYMFSSSMAAGILALFMFNMTMPITLYLLVEQWKELPGFSFGLLTFGLFLGFLPVYLNLEVPTAGSVVGMAGSLISLLILMIGIACVKKEWRDK